jgi:glycerol transport system permease protein
MKLGFGTSAKSLLAVIVIVVFAFPLYFTVVTSLSSMAWIESAPFYPDFSPENYVALTVGLGGGGKGYSTATSNWPLGIQNSLTISLISVALNLLLAFPAAYALSRVQFLGDKHLFFWLLTNFMAPPIALALPYLVIWRSLGIWDTLPGIIVAYTVFNSPISVWLLTSFMGNVPKEVDEAAFIDGHNLSSYMRRMFLRMLMPGIGVTAFFIWLFTWTEAFLGSVITSYYAEPLTVQMLTALGRMGYGVQWGILAACGIVTMVPGIVLLYWVRSYLAKGFTFGRL